MTAFSVRGSLRHDESMARHTSWKVGGPADLFFEPADVSDLADFLGQLPPDMPILWIGLGSNLLVRDGGFRGAVIRTQRALGTLERAGETDVQAGAGLACAKLARFCAREGLEGGEFFGGIPGTVGGALAMNAGAWGGETWECVVEVETLDRSGARHRRAPGDFEIGYRRVVGRESEWFIAARLRFRPGGDPDALGARVRELLAKRAASQPTGQPSCGSVFRNPPGDHAARLIEAAGMKGLARGGAQVSPKHANFIINTGEATAADIEGLIGEVRERVLERHGVRLTPEVRLVGEEVRA